MITKTLLNYFYFFLVNLTQGKYSKLTLTGVILGQHVFSKQYFVFYIQNNA